MPTGTAPRGERGVGNEEPALHAGPRVSVAQLVLLVLAIGLLVWLLRPEAAIFMAVLGCVAVVAGIPAIGARYRLDDDALTITRWWGRAERYALAGLKRVQIQSGLTATVAFGGKWLSVTLAPQRADHAAIIERLRARLDGPRPPALDRASGTTRVRIAALATLPVERCAVCGETRGVAAIPVTAHHGLTLVAAGWMVRRGFGLPTCRWHRWRRRLGSGLVVLCVAISFFVGVGLSVALPPGDALRPLGYSLLCAFVVLLLLAENDVTKYFLDSALLGVRLGWLSKDGDSSALYITSPEAERLIHADLERDGGTLVAAPIVSRE